jgi:hypothetical protein
MRNLLKLSVTAGVLALGALAPLTAANAADMGVPDSPPPQAQYAPPPAYYGPPPAAEAYVYPPPPAYYPPPPVAYYSYDVPAYYAQPYYYAHGYWRGYGPRFAYGYGRGYGGRWHR